MASGLHGDIEVAAVPVHEEEDGRAGPDAGELPLEVVHALHGLLIDLGDHVAGLDAGARGGTAVLHAAHQDSLLRRQAELRRELPRHGLHGDAERRPAPLAGPPSATDVTSAPWASGRLKLFARSVVTRWIVTPRYPRTTWPEAASCVRTGLARLMGIAKPIPTEPPDRETIAALIPTAWPWALMSGPPLLPGLMDASVWMKSSYGPSPITRPVALTMPVVTVCSSPKGLPIAITGSPTWSREESPRGTTGSPVASTLSNAMSVFGSRPTTRLGSSRATASVSAAAPAIQRLIGSSFRSAPVVRFRRAASPPPAGGPRYIRGPYRRGRPRAGAPSREAGGFPPSAA